MSPQLISIYTNWYWYWYWNWNLNWKWKWNWWYHNKEASKCPQASPEHNWRCMEFEWNTQIDIHIQSSALDRLSECDRERERERPLVIQFYVYYVYYTCLPIGKWVNPISSFEGKIEIVLLNVKCESIQVKFQVSLTRTETKVGPTFVGPLDWLYIYTLYLSIIHHIKLIWLLLGNKIIENRRTLEWFSRGKKKRFSEYFLGPRYVLLVSKFWLWGLG